MDFEHEISYLTELKQFAENGELRWLANNEMWVQQYPFDSWTHPVFSDTVIDHDRATKLKDSFDHGVRGTKIFADYEHGLDAAKGSKAAGSIKELKVVDEPRGVFTQPGLWARVQFSDTARHEIDSGEWNYWSTTHFDEWKHPQTGQVHEMVYDGGGLTNKPYVKGMVPLNFSELGISKEFAVWSTAMQNDLPDSSFCYIEPGGTKDSSGKTTPRSLRHLPYKDASGKVDLVHVRDALARLDQVQNMPASAKASCKSRLERLLGAKSYDEQLAILDEELVVDDDNVVDPPVDAVDDNGNIIVVDPPAVVDKVDDDKGGEKDVELEKELRAKLGLADDVDIVKAVTDLNDEVTPMREVLKAHSERKAFSEAFPDEFARMVRLEKSEQDRSAKAFSEQYTNVRLTEKKGDDDEATTLGFSGLVIQNLEGLAKEFSEGTATLDSVKTVIDSITNSGVVDYGTRGSSREDDSLMKDEDAIPSGGVRETRKLFAEKVAEVMKADELDYQTALRMAADKYPVLAEAYHSAGMERS
jgi:hypothetical protein